MIQTGSLVLDFKANADKMKTGWRGPTSFALTFWVDFSLPFSARPSVLLSVTGIDAGNNDTTKFSVEPTDIGLAGFNVTLHVHASNDINAITVSFLALEP